MHSTTITRLIRAPRASIYKALLNPTAIAQWKVPDDMSCKVHEFEAREGGRLRISLTYADAAGKGKTSSHTDTYHGRFIKLVPNALVVEEDEFETDDPAMQGRMMVTIRLKDVAGGTEVTGIHENLPPGVTLKDNELGWQLAFKKLALLMEKNNETGLV